MILSRPLFCDAPAGTSGWRPIWADQFEEPPPTIYDYLKRDRRWAQGNLQHSRILSRRASALPSRLHMAMGIMSYLASPLWLLMLVVSALSLVPYAAPPEPVTRPRCCNWRRRP